MLVLGRGEGQEINVHTSDGLIKVVYLRHKPGSTLIRIGIEAPANVRILRAELERNGAQPDASQ